ncbi:MAG: hypothetical protein L0332_09395 [Chloroflexi bacterium]|nr:hypothetical protein [Chloroflexota bacterium]MCI0579367.1 hypothetical protein [Chloroflexota bacterium]MCI0646215.1 hypothetical protein [Chloroflexota bacterium]MCI0726920.1 hypothetical protein [Chloroflexota bacterium]
MDQNLMPFLWVGLTLPALLLMQRWIHRHLHGVAFLLTGNKNWAVVLYALILFPGVLLHELSHWLTANLLGVRTGAFSVIPRATSDGSIQLGYVEYYKTRHLGPLRESLIGSAPLLVGTGVTLLISFFVFDAPGLAEAVQAGDIDALTLALTRLLSTNDFLLWLYLFFAVSNAMMPSTADRRAWPAFILFLVVAGVILYALGLREMLLTGLAGPVATVFGYLGLAFSLTIGVNVVFIFLIYFVERLLSRIKGVDLVYGQAGEPAGNHPADS